MSEKEKREVIARGFLGIDASSPAKRCLGDWKGTEKEFEAAIKNMPDGTPIEIVALRPAKPERRLVKPKGEWKASNTNARAVHFKTDGVGLIASIFSLDSSMWFWYVSPRQNGYVETLELAKQAAEKNLANAKLYGFHWEVVEPEYIRYMITVIDKDGDKTWRHSSSRENAEVFFNLSDRRKTAIMVLAAQDGQLNWHELDRYETSGE